MIGIIGHGMVGSAVAHAFRQTEQIVSDPALNNNTVADVCSADPVAIFVSVPTPTDDSDYALLKSILQQIKDSGYTGLTVVKSTVLPHHLANFDVLYNPEFLSRATAIDDFVNPVYVIIGGDRGQELLDLYKQYSTVDTSNTYLLDIPTACLVKYTMNTFFATKVAFMNQIHEVAQKMGADFDAVSSIVKTHPWIGSNHVSVPGPDGKPGFGGPCLPKDTAALTKEYQLELLNTVLELNNRYRK
jgi:UDPglucose 6-dehydrogenase